MQLLFAVAGLGLGPLLPRVAVAPTVASSRVTETLIGVGFGVLGLVSIIFSLLFLWRTFGLAVGVFVFSVSAALVIGNDPEVSVIVPAAEVIAVLAARGRGIIDDLYPQPGPSDRHRAAPLPPLRRAVTWPRRRAILQQLDVHQPPPCRCWTQCRASWRRWHHGTWT